MVACFAGDTPIRTPDGATLISKLQVGDQVLARSEYDVNAPVVPRQIEEVFVREAFLLDLTVQGRKITTTAEHPFYVKDFGWLAAGQLVEGDFLSTESGEWAPVEAVSKQPRFATVYNLRVAVDHTYFLSPRSALRRG
jgi:Pretoxin HINT domain